jgi:hypothetical protein
MSQLAWRVSVWKSPLSSRPIRQNTAGTKRDLLQSKVTESESQLLIDSWKIITLPFRQSKCWIVKVCVLFWWKSRCSGYNSRFTFGRIWVLISVLRNTALTKVFRGFPESIHLGKWYLRGGYILKWPVCFIRLKTILVMATTLTSDTVPLRPVTIWCTTETNLNTPSRKEMWNVVLFWLSRCKASCVIRASLK